VDVAIAGDPAFAVLEYGLAEKIGARRARQARAVLRSMKFISKIS
jgi:hypothetical protein